METKKILFPTDFSHLSDAAMEEATSLARDRGAKLIIVHVEEPPAAYGGGEMYYGLPDPDDQALREMLAAVKPTDENIQYEHRLLTGDPASEVVRLAEEENVDLIIMATHGRTGLMRFLMGSVAEAIVRRSPCPVMTFKGKTEHVSKS